MTTLALTACVNLKEVREFAGESAKLSGYTELATRFRDTYQREEPYLFDAAAAQARENDTRRKAAYQDLLSIHQSANLYMMTLAQLAGESAFDLAPQIDAVSAQIKPHPEWGVDAARVEAYAKVVKIIARWVTSRAQEKAVQEMVKEGGEPMQVTLEGMQKLVSIYRKTYENEKRSVLGFLETNIALLTAPADQPVVALLRVHLQAKEREYAETDGRYAAAEKGLSAVAEGHKALLQNIDKLSLQQTRDKLNQYRKDIKAVREIVQALGR
jgi:hypothetical protein